MSNYHAPTSVLEGLDWPAVPSPADARILALAYQLEQSQWWPPHVLAARQLQQAETLCTHARRDVPFYRERLGVIAKLKRGALGLEQWRALPILTRAEVQERGTELINHRLPDGHGPAGDISTSGSTGRPVTLKTSQTTQLFYQAVNLRYHQWHERDFLAKICAIRTLGAEGDTGKVGWVPGHASQPVSIFDVTRPVAQQLDWLLAEKPDYLLTYPNNLDALIRHAAEVGRHPSGLREVSTMSEVLDAETRALSENTWGVPVVDAYSAQEVGMIALQCPRGTNYHVQAESVMLEVLDERNRPCPPGQIGRVVITDLKNLASPMIRYEIGDYAELGRPCECGRGLPNLTRILGRSRNMLSLPNGDRLWPRFASSRLARAAPVRQAQLVQVSLDEIHVNLVVARDLSAEEEDALGQLIGASLGHPFTLRFKYTDEIPRAPSGKFEDFRSEI